MEYFKKYFADVEFDVGTEEVKVLCPFHNDTHPSASINTKDNLFHCWVCDVGYNEQQFIAKVNNISIADATKILDKFQENSAQANWEISEKASLWANEEFLKHVEALGLSRDTIDELDLGLIKDELGRLYLGIPVIYNSVIMDIRRYNLLKYENVPKMKSNADAKMGFVIPFDIWKDSKGLTYILEGEKDMMLARELGINAITLTGGAGATLNKYVINAFKDRDFIVCYDNDDAGRSGMNGIYNQLKSVARSIKYLKIGDVVKEEKEDFHDFIMKYGKDAFDFYALKEYEFGEITDSSKNYITVNQALLKNNLRRDLISKVSVTAEYEDAYAVPQHAKLTKMDDDKGTLLKGETRNWTLDDDNAYQALELIEADAKKTQVLSKIKTFVGLDPKESNLDIVVSQYATVYKIKIMDVDINTVEDVSDSSKNISLDLYAFQPMIVGKQYEISYKIYPHPTKNQKLVGIATSVVEIDSSKDFKPNKELLSKLQSKGTVEERLDLLYQSAKHYVAKHLNYQLWLMTDLVFNSILEFDYGQRIRGALDVFILGDTQVGKSETTSELNKLYDWGHFLSLKTSTTVGLIGGSNKVEGTWLNTIGAIPRQHRKMVIMEEFSGAKPEFIKTMTDIRSSGYLNFARAAGETKVPCRLRMITLSNPINDAQGNPRHLSTFPNGIAPLMELIKSAEDVARYDGFLLVPKPQTRINPFLYKLQGEPIAKEAYVHKIQWVYTRKPEDVIFEDGVESYIWEQSEILNSLFECNFPLFTTTTSLKLARFCVALASLLVNTDSTYTKVVVSKEIVDYIVEFLMVIYDNPVFKLNDYKIEYDSYNQIDKSDIAHVQKIYNNHSTMFEFLNHQSSTSRANLRSISGLDGDSFNPVFNVMVKLKLIKISGENVFPTERFRLAMERINKEFTHDDTNIMVKEAD